MDIVFNAAFKIFNWFCYLPITWGNLTIYVYQIFIFVIVGAVLLSIVRRII